MLANVVTAIDRYRIGYDGALVACQRRVSERADQDPREKAYVVNAFDVLLGALLSIRWQVAQPGQILGNRSGIALLKLVQLGELERKELSQAGLELCAKRVLARTALQVLVELEILFDAR